MTANELQSQRNAVVRCALSWENTPFAHDASVKGAGCDCSHLGMSFSEALGVTINWPARYNATPQWFMNADPESGAFKEIYLQGLIDNGFIELSDYRPHFEPFRLFPDLKSALPADFYRAGERWIDAAKDVGDIAITRVGRLFVHGAIIEKWPQVIQAEPHVCGRGKVCRATADANYFLSHREMRFFSWKGWH